MLDFIKQDELKCISIFCDQISRRAIGGDSDRKDVLFTAIIDADFGLKGVDEPRVPLMNQRNCWDNDNGRSVHVTNGLNGHEGLASSSRQNDAPSLSSLLPGIKGSKLIIVRLSRLIKCECQVLPARDIIANTPFPQPGTNRAIMIRFASPPLFDELKWWRNLLVGLNMLENQCASLEKYG